MADGEDQRGARADGDRLTFDDALFETMRRVLDTPVVSQTGWRFDTTLESTALARFHAALGRGPLARRLVRSRVPGARDRWTGSDAIAPLVESAPVTDLGGWLAEQAATPLDPEHGPAWSLAYAPLADGGSTLSFVTSHVVADGGLKLRALEAAATGRPIGVLPADGPTSGRAGDLGDAVRQLATAARTLPGLVLPPRLPARRPTSRPASRAARTAPRPDDDVPWTPPVVILDCPTDEWQWIAAADGGSANALLLALCAELAVRAGLAAPGETIDVASPVSTRTEDDLRSNASTGVSIPVPLDAAGRVASLFDLRGTAREVYAGLADRDAAADPLAAARAVLPLLPASVVRLLAPRWPAPRVLASNLGTLPAGVLSPTGVTAGSVLNRSLTPPTTRGAARRTGAGLSAWWGSTGTTATLCVAGADPDAFPDADTLRTHLEAVLRDRGIATVRLWS